MVRESHRVSIRTKYLGPTNYRGSRVRVWRGDSSYRDDPNSLEIGWDYSSEVSENHSAAVSAYVGRAGWDGQWMCGATESGCVAVWVGDR